MYLQVMILLEFVNTKMHFASFLAKILLIYLFKANPSGQLYLELLVMLLIIFQKSEQLSKFIDKYFAYFRLQLFLLIFLLLAGYSAFVLTTL